MTIVKPLYNHTNLESAYCAENYPYGRLRTNMYFWLETKNSKGVRIVSQSLNPKTGRMNKPHPGNYHAITANLYLDENGHCEFAVLNEYTEADKVYEFIQNFPENHRMDLIKAWCLRKYGFHRLRTDNKRSYFTINGVESEYSEAECEKDLKEQAEWWKAYLLAAKKDPNTPQPETKKKD